MVETNSLDLMQNINVIYRPESIIEFQIATLLMMKFFHLHWQPKFLYEHSDNVLTDIFLAEHILSYVISFIRLYDLKKNGNPDQSGI